MWLCKQAKIPFQLLLLLHRNENHHCHERHFLNIVPVRFLLHLLNIPSWFSWGGLLLIATPRRYTALPLSTAQTCLPFPSLPSPHAFRRRCSFLLTDTSQRRGSRVELQGFSHLLQVFPSMMWFSQRPIFFSTSPALTYLSTFGIPTGFFQGHGCISCTR